ncbi:MAG TPA: bifunctional 4-hydroxy-2-oxoglutarate aldolase/2-dehydro-3-deoxy-phosphogluconate aldolase [Verrucomicrobiae bacterium]|jgi:2-dehydro-3-deoxyphosphogluconate aldolase/(4S)-4-hydroxy-2-oxoglutarate aldolase|nr:bifunctional 4-hydroxy-2-oxoglutarate aldolase/2-dehydro-3-deoxy-phosphogluconate aldolase [Verrucomicrobiae bacterium]
MTAPPETVFDRVARIGLVPVIIIDRVEHALPLADALLAGGLPVAEITFRTAAAEEVIRILSRERPQLLVGAGTVLTGANLEAAKASGAAFGVAPGLNPQIVNQARELGLPFVPGVVTPSEIEIGMSLGCKVLKFFPAEALGGTAMIDALAAPFKHTGVRFVPSGGVTPGNLESYLKLGCVAAAGGTWIAKPEDLKEGNWEQISARCRAVVESVKRAREAGAQKSKASQ